MEADIPEEEEVIRKMSKDMTAQARKLVVLTRRLWLLEEQIAGVKERMIEAADGHEYAPVTIGDVKVSVYSRKPPRVVDVVGLVKAGRKKEEFSTVKPSVKALYEMGRKLNWTDRHIEQYILDGKGAPTWYVRTELLEQEEDE